MKRELFCSDVFEWLNQNPLTDGTSVVASMPDFSEFSNTTLGEYKNIFTDMAEKILIATPPNDVTIFYQSDIKVDGRWLDKAFLVQKAAEKLDHAQLWHKVICRVPPGMTTFGRPSYTHILAFSKNYTIDPKDSSADVLPQMGEKLWERGMGVKGAMMMAKFIKEKVGSHTLVNPFCGMGSLLAVGNAYELNVVGIERSPKRLKSAEVVKFSIETESFSQ